MGSKSKKKTTSRSKPSVKIEEDEEIAAEATSTAAAAPSASHGGVYNLTESGLEYHHIKNPPAPPKNSREFLERFQYVCVNIYNVV